MMLSIALLSLIWENGTLPPAGRAYPAYGFFKTDTTWDWLPMAYGSNASGGTTQTNYWYDISANSWQTKTNGPSPARYDAGGTFHLYNAETRLFVFGGYTGSSSFTSASHYYTYSNDTWTNIANYPYSAEGIAVASFGAYIYTMGGHRLFNILNNCYQYDPSGAGGGTYTARANLLTAVADAGTAVANNGASDRIYLFGGVADILGNPTTVVQEYNPGNNSWQYRANLPGPARSGVAVAVLRNKCYVMGGTNLTAGPANYDRVDIYDPANNTWSVGPTLPGAWDGDVATAPDFPLQGVSLVRPVNDATCCNDTLFWRRGTGAVKIVYAGTGTATSVINTCQRLRSVVQGYVLKYDTLSNFATASVVWNNMDGSGTDDRDTTEPLSNLTLVDDHWYYWTVGVVDDMPDTAWSADTFRFYYDCEPAYDEVNESSGDAKPSLENALARGPDILLAFVTPLSGLYSLRIYDSGGRLAWLREFGAEQGRNELPVWLSGPGVYMAIIEGQGISERARIVVTGR